MGQDTQPIPLFVKWPRCIRAILYKQLTALPDINQSPRPWTGKQLPNCLSLPKSAGQKQSRRRSKGCWSVLSRKLQAKGTSQPRDHLSSKQAQYSHHLETKKSQLMVTAHNLDPTELLVVLPALCRKMGVPYYITKGTVRLGCLVHRNFHRCCLHTG